MAFNNKKLAVLSYASGFTQWHYFTDDKLQDVIGNDKYFISVYAFFNVGDVMLINAKDGAGFRVVTQIKDKQIKFGKLS